MSRLKLFNGPISVPAGLKQSKNRFCNFAVNRSFDIRAADQITEIDLYDEIGYWGVDAARFRSMLRGTGDIKLRIHSPGGDVFDGISIYNDLVNHPGKVHVEIPGLAASAASLIAMAGDTITMAPSAFLMIHNVWTMSSGDRHAFRDVADMMEPIDMALVDVYTDRAIPDASEVETMMDVETWIGGEEAVSLGFADEIIESESPKAKFDLSGFENAPNRWHLEKPEAPTTSRDLEQLLTRDAGYSRSQARALMRNGFKGMPSAAQRNKVVKPGADESLKPFQDLIKDLII